MSSTTSSTTSPATGVRTRVERGSKPGANQSGPRRPTGTAPDPEAGVNLAVLWGRCSAGVEIRTLESGTRLASLSIRTPPGSAPAGRGGGPRSATSVPVVVWDPPAWLEAVAPGDALVVVGTVRRRFFATRAGGRGAKAEVEAVHVARASDAQRSRAWRRASALLDALT